MNTDCLWVESERPNTLDNCILPSKMKEMFNSYIEKGMIPNLLLCGSAGVGKTTVAKALVNELGCDSIVINGSLNGNIDTLRNTIMDFASTTSFSGGRKYVILDEADYLNPTSTQPALRNFMEEFSSNCGFILTCNYTNRIIEPLRSRCSTIEFTIPKEEKKDLAIQFFLRSKEILEKYNVEYDKATLAEVTKLYFPDFRKTLNTLQAYASTGKIDSGILSQIGDGEFKTLMKFMRAKDFSNVNSWVVEHGDLESSILYSRLYECLHDELTSETLPIAILYIAKYQYQDSFVANKNINTVACLLEIMADVMFR